MADFLEERISADILTGAAYQDDYLVNIVTTSGGNEYRSLTHQFPVRKFDISYLMEKVGMWEKLLNLYHRAHGKYGGFRIRAIDDYKTCAVNASVNSIDQPTLYISSGVYQLVKTYGTDKTAGATGYPYRKIKKPVTGTVVVAKNGVSLGSGWSVDYTTGVLTIGPAPLITDVITWGGEFDIPVRFNTTLPVGQDHTNYRSLDGIELIELLNP